MLQRSVGYTTRDDGAQVPSYGPPQTVSFQIQAATGDDLKQLDGQNIQGSHRALYAYGDLAAVLRPAQVGGDIVVLPDSTTWLMTMALEPWDGRWCKMAITRQMNQSPIEISVGVFILGNPA
jgi:hypothetical protein